MTALPATVTLTTARLGALLVALLVTFAAGVWRYYLASRFQPVRLRFPLAARGMVAIGALSLCAGAGFGWLAHTPPPALPELQARGPAAPAPAEEAAPLPTRRPPARPLEDPARPLEDPAPVSPLAHVQPEETVLRLLSDPDAEPSITLPPPAPLEFAPLPDEPVEPAAEDPPVARVEVPTPPEDPEPPVADEAPDPVVAQPEPEPEPVVDLAERSEELEARAKRWLYQRKLLKCHNCGVDGEHRCGSCNGRGYLVTVDLGREGGGGQGARPPCPTCGGDGQADCAECEAGVNTEKLLDLEEEFGMRDSLLKSYRKSSIRVELAADGQRGTVICETRAYGAEEMALEESFWQHGPDGWRRVSRP